MAAVGSVRGTASRPTTRVGMDRRPNIGVARRPRGVAAAKTTLATPQAETETPRSAIPVVPTEGTGVKRRTAAAAPAAGALARIARAATRPFLDGAPLAVGVTPAVARPLVSPAGALMAKGTVIQIAEVGLMVSELRPLATAPLAVQTGVSPTGAEGVIIAPVDAATANETGEGRPKATALRPGAPVHGAEPTPAQRRRGLLAPVTAEMGGSLATASEMGPALAPAPPSAGVVMVRRFLVGRAVLRERGRAETVREDGALEAGAIATAVATWLAEARVGRVAVPALVGRVAFGRPAKEAANGQRQAVVMAPARCGAPSAARPHFKESQGKKTRAEPLVGSRPRKRTQRSSTSSSRAATLTHFGPTPLDERLPARPLLRVRLFAMLVPANPTVAYADLTRVAASVTPVGVSIA